MAVAQTIFPLRAYALNYTTNWSKVCSIHWEDTIPDITQGGRISPLDLMDNDHSFDVTTHVWCLDSPNVTDQKGQYINAIVQSQTSPGSSLYLQSKDPKHSDSVIPFTACLGQRELQAHMCIDKINEEASYVWGDGKTPSLTPSFLIKRKDGDPVDPEGKHWGVLTYDYIGHVHIYIDRAKIVTPPVPGDYVDNVKVLFSGVLATGHGGSWYSPLPEGVDITANNNPTLQVNAHFVDACRIESAPDVNFSGAFSSEMTQTQNVVVTCTNSTPFTVSFQSENNPAEGQGQMKGQNGQGFINYGIYSDPAFTQRWDLSHQFKGTGKAQTIPVYYRTDSSQQNQKAGTYTDTVTMVVNF